MATSYRKRSVADLQGTKGYQRDTVYRTELKQIANDLDRSPAEREAASEELAKMDYSLGSQAERLAKLKKYVGTQRGLSIIAKLLTATGRKLQGQKIGDLSHLTPKIGSSSTERAATLQGLREEKSALLKEIEGARQFKQNLAASIHKDRATQQAALLNAIGRVTTAVAGNVTDANNQRGLAHYKQAQFLEDSKKNMFFTRDKNQDHKTLFRIENAVTDALIPRGSWEVGLKEKAVWNRYRFWDGLKKAFGKATQPGDLQAILEEAARAQGADPSEVRQSLRDDMQIAAGKDAAEATMLAALDTQLNKDATNAAEAARRHATIDKEIEDELQAGEDSFIAGGVSEKMIKAIGGALKAVNRSGEEGASEEELSPFFKTINEEMLGLGDGDTISDERMKQIRQIEALELMYKNALGSRPIQEAFKLMEDSEAVDAIRQELNGKGYNLSKRDTVQLILRNRRMGLQLGRDETSLVSGKKRDATLLKEQVDGGENLADVEEKKDLAISKEAEAANTEELEQLGFDVPGKTTSTDAITDLLRDNKWIKEMAGQEVELMRSPGADLIQGGNPPTVPEAPDSSEDPLGRLGGDELQQKLKELAKGTKYEIKSSWDKDE